jgi:hypothetical protein
MDPKDAISMEWVVEKEMAEDGETKRENSRYTCHPSSTANVQCSITGRQ